MTTAMTTKVLARMASAVIGLQVGLACQAAWTPLNVTGPSARDGHGMAYDSSRGRTVLFGGSANAVIHGDTWEWDGATWIPQIFAAGPSPRTRHAMVFDSQRGRTVLFGGSDSGGRLADTWEWDGASWTLVASTGPSPRTGYAMAYDSQRGKTVLFGGIATGNVYLGDTWEWDGTIWTQVSSTGPLARYSHAMAYDSQRGRTVLFGGALSTWYAGDTWEWDGTSWTQVATGGATHRYGHAMAYDSLRGRTVLFGGLDLLGVNLGDTWEWDGTTWTQVGTTGPSSRWLHALSYDYQSGRTVLFGGSTAGVGFLGDTWVTASSRIAGATSFGSGCGSPVLQLTQVANARPVINTTAQLEVIDPPLPLSYVAIGWSRTAFGAFSLPLPLAGFGLPGCSLLQSAEVMASTTATGPATATYSLSLPNWTGLIGLHLYLQAWAPAPGQNAAGLIVSNGVEWAIGNT